MQIEGINSQYKYCSYSSIHIDFGQRIFYKNKLNKTMSPVFRLFLMETDLSVWNNDPSDISREQFEQIRQSLEGFKKQAKPRSVDLYEFFCALLYLLRSGCQLRMLSSDFPKWRTVYSYY